VVVDSKVNRLLLLNVTKSIVMPLNGLVKWDRYALRNDRAGFIYGWIKRTDGHYDFVSFNFWMDGVEFAFGFTTSSKKYSEELGRRLGQKIDTHVECRSVSDMPEAELVDWQNTAQV